MIGPLNDILFILMFFFLIFDVVFFAVLLSVLVQGSIWGWVWIVGGGWALAEKLDLVELNFFQLFLPAVLLFWRLTRGLGGPRVQRPLAV